LSLNHTTQNPKNQIYHTKVSENIARAIPEDGEGMRDEPRDGGREERARQCFLRLWIPLELGFDKRF
jgi:hypothetical protein